MQINVQRRYSCSLAVMIRMWLSWHELVSLSWLFRHQQRRWRTYAFSNCLLVMFAADSVPWCIFFVNIFWQECLSQSWRLWDSTCIIRPVIITIRIYLKIIFTHRHLLHYITDVFQSFFFLFILHIFLTSEWTEMQNIGKNTCRDYFIPLPILLECRWNFPAGIQGSLHR